ncbi:MAG TPA: DUF1992 domain-containing protein [Acidimicrobiales bacterium]|jgi:hypothetical protein
MTGRKPPGIRWESWVDRQIREGIERGDFDDLPGAGQPIPDLDEPHDELWWVRKKLRAEQVDYLPPTLALRKELDDTRDRIAGAATESEVVELVRAINQKIVYVNSHATSGPPSTLLPLDLEQVLDGWRTAGERAPGPDRGSPRDL